MTPAEWDAYHRGKATRENADNWAAFFIGIAAGAALSLAIFLAFF